MSVLSVRVHFGTSYLGDSLGPVLHLALYEGGFHVEGMETPV